MGVRKVLEQLLEVTTNYLHIKKQRDGNNQLAVHYSTLILYRVNKKFWVEMKLILVSPST